MRQCPKCGEQYADTDFRTLCSQCMVSLETVTAVPAATPMDQPGPVSLGGPSASGPSIAPTITIPSIDIAMPTIDVVMPSSATMPMMDGYMPQMAMPAMDAVMPQSSMMPPVESVPGTAVSVQTSASLTAAAPEIAAKPAISATVDAQPIPPVRSFPPPSAPVGPASPATTAAARATATTASITPTAPATRSIAADDKVSGQASKGLMWFVGGILGFIAFFSWMGLVSAPDGGRFFWSVVWTLGCVATIRHAIYRSAIAYAKIVPMADPRLGGMLPVEIIIGALTPVEVSAAKLTLVAQEVIAEGQGKQSKTYRETETLLRREVPLPAIRGLVGDQETRIPLAIEIPADGVPSFAGSSQKIEWKLHLWVGIPGWYPDIRLAKDIMVPPVRVGASVRPQIVQQVQLPGLGEDMHATLEIGAVGDATRPVLEAGSRVPLTLSIIPETQAQPGKLWVELGYTVTGRNQEEHLTVDRAQFFPGGWTAGMPQQQTVTLDLPAQMPVTYQGRMMRVTWKLTVRKEVPWKPDIRCPIAVQVAPRQV